MSEGLKRGNLLWEGPRMFLPEHKEQLLERKRKHKEFQPPDLDENRLEEINRMIVESIEFDKALTITYADKYGPAEFWGWVTKINQSQRWLNYK